MLAVSKDGAEEFSSRANLRTLHTMIFVLSANPKGWMEAPRIINRV